MVQLYAVGCDGRRHEMMTTLNATATKAKTGLAQILVTAALGLALMVVAGHVQSQTLHDAAHDMRHATGFPCH